jgi:uncharacterized protein YjbJ (UPF0337 family)
MNWGVIAGDWKQLKSKVEKQWSKLTEHKLNVIGGKRFELAGKAQETYGAGMGEVEKQVKIFTPTNNDYRMKRSR